MHLKRNTILDIQLVQVTVFSSKHFLFFYYVIWPIDFDLSKSIEVGGSAHMEKEGLRRGLDLLESNQLHVDYIVTDRNIQVEKFLRERNVKQFYDVWHLEKGKRNYIWHVYLFWKLFKFTHKTIVETHILILLLQTIIQKFVGLLFAFCSIVLVISELSKKLDKLSRNCKLLRKWSQGIKNHMYWSAMSSKEGPKKIAKWKSFLNHIQNVHTHDDPLFPKCAHLERVSRDPSKWFRPGVWVLFLVCKSN